MITPPWYQDKTERLAFNAYAIHSDTVEEIIQAIGNGARSIPDVFLTQSDERYIEQEVYRRYGIVCHL